VPVGRSAQLMPAREARDREQQVIDLYNVWESSIW
jgi:hypothetical protein